ncbi:CRISPR-associated protein Cas4 [Pectinatus brassicae]|uniref:CRISPR-associated exonuclease Cas4 n=1 Tax=Pectinatus brassicae TaxID=862415 RepID=A0A840UXA5_9FIRM|nr:CRISPR-associated protein Cas4 [Pectinatus brassicae]MBB5337025.1 CRISPR-associated exonuclease Cas4 [Pectinatus brassicae]
MKKITGVMYSYYFLCKRKLWLFAHDINMEQESEAVFIGKLIDESTYKRENKHILIDDTINIDYINNGIVCEVKKSKKEKQMAINQIKYYLYILQQHNLMHIKGRLVIPKERISEDVELSEQDSCQIEENLQAINEILNLSVPPSTDKKAACKSCAYYEFCYI